MPNQLIKYFDVMKVYYYVLLTLYKTTKQALVDEYVMIKSVNKDESMKNDETIMMRSVMTRKIWKTLKVVDVDESCRRQQEVWTAQQLWMI
jgi:hypothetical protein